MKNHPSRFRGRLPHLVLPILLALVVALCWMSGRNNRTGGNFPPSRSEETSFRKPPESAPAPANPGAEPMAAAGNDKRVAPFLPEKLGPLAALKGGDTLTLPLPGGGEVAATVNLVQTEADGTVRVGGAITSGSGGGFFLGAGGGKFGGMILLPDAGLAYVIGAEPDGTITIREKPISEVVCQNMPIAGDPPAGGPAPAPKPEEAPPILSSRPGATAVLYLDFDGETVTDVAWNNGLPVVAAPSELTNAEISEVWARAKEDFWPFNVDVTTNLQRYQNAPVGRRMRAIITPTNAARPGSGGVAYVNSFSQAGQFAFFSSTIPCWVFNGGIVGSAETISHELGHTLGLSHDGRPGQEYYGGHGNGAVGWGPIMGAAFYQELVQWSKGEYSGANNLEDDVAIIAGAANGFGYVADDAGNTRATAASLGVASGTVSKAGIISSASDSDFYSFSVAVASEATITAEAAQLSPNLDIALELQNAAGTVLTSSNLDLATGAGVFSGISPGTYYLKISGTGRGDVLGDGYSNYGSIGQYSLSGTITALGLPLISSSTSADGVTGAPFGYQIVASNSPASYGVTGTLPPGLTLNGGTGRISGTPTAAGVYPVTVTATNPAGPGSLPLTITVVAGSYFSNAAAISIPTEGQANPYPSTISVSGFSGLAKKVVVRLFGLNHTWPSDVDVLLVGPGGQNVMLLSDVGSSTSISAVNLTFDDNAPSFPGVPLLSGEYPPVNYGLDDTLPLPAPDPPHGASLSAFSQLNPNGTWKLFVADDAGGDAGSIAGGWSLTILPNPPVVASPPEGYVSADGGSGGFGVVTEGAWSWSSNAAWVMSADPVNQQGNRSFRYSVAANTSTSARSAVITLTSGPFTATHTVFQTAAQAGESTRILEQVLADGSQSVWRTYGGNGLEESSLATPAAFHGDAFDGVGQLDVRARDGFGTVTATNVWTNHGIVPQTGTFAATFSTIPGSANVDTVIGFSQGTADFWDDLAACVRFNPLGTVDARNGSDFAAVTPFTYTAGVSYLVEMQVNVVTKRYRATIMPPSGAPVVIADDFAFRTEQAAVTRLANFACLTWTGGSQTVSGLVVPTLGTVTATNVWGNHPIRERHKELVASFTTTPSSNAMDSVFGFSAAPADFWDDLAAYLRFNPQGKIDARNGDGFAAAADFSYSAGTPYRISIEIDIDAKRYWAAVIAPGGSPVLIANGYSFRSEQNAITQLSNFSYLAWTGGTQTVGNLVVTDLGNVTANNVWANHSVAPQAGTFSASFLTTPSGPAVDTSIGFSSEPADFWDDLAAYVRFNPLGKIDARAGAGFAALTDLSYTPGVPYLVEMEINVATHTYSVNVTPAGGTPVPIAYDFPFRSEQNAVTSLSNFVYLTWTGGVQAVRNFAISGSRIDLPNMVSSGPAGPLAATAEAAETRVTKEIRLVAGLHAADEVITVQNLSGWPREITIQLADNYGSDSGTFIHRTSSGDAILDQDDRWFVSNDRTDTSSVSYDPTLMVSWVHSANLPEPRLLEVPGALNDRLRLYFVGTLAGGDTATVTVRRQLFETAAQAISQGRPVGSGIADLSDLAVSAGLLTPGFFPSVTDYQTNVPSGVTSITVTPTVAQPGATVRVNGNPVGSGSPSGAIPLSVGSTPVAIQVTSQDGTTIRNYSLSVLRILSRLQLWRLINFGNPENSGDAANSFDYDHDGISNMMEYAFETDPKNASSWYEPRGRWNGPDFEIYHYDRYNQVFFDAEWSTTLKPGEWHPAPDLGDGAGEHIFRFPPGVGPHAYLRIKVTVSSQ